MPATTKIRPDAVNDPAQAELLIKRIAQGDRDALAELYSACRVSVYGFAMSILKEKTDAEDVLQEVFVRVWQSAPGYRAQGKPMAWLLTIARNLSNDAVRGRNRLSPLSEELPTEGGSERSDDRIVLDAAMSVLAKDERQIVMLHAVSGMRHREIAQILSMPLSTVLSKYSRATKKLQKEIRGGEAN